MRLEVRLSLRRMVALALLFSLCYCPLQAEGAALKLRVKEGDGASNRIKKGISRRLVVRAEDENGNPLRGAIIVFQLPENGAGGSFDSSQTGAFRTVETGDDGEAAAVFMPNDTTGAFRVKVHGSYEASSGIVEIRQANTKGSSRFVWALVGAGAAAGGLAASRGTGKGSTTTSTPPTPPTITAGTGTFGRP